MLIKQYFSLSSPTDSVALSFSKATNLFSQSLMFTAVGLAVTRWVKRAAQKTINSWALVKSSLAFTSTAKLSAATMPINGAPRTLSKGKLLGDSLNHSAIVRVDVVMGDRVTHRRKS